MDLEIEYTIVDEEDDRVLLETFDLADVMRKLEELGDDMGHVSVSAWVDSIDIDSCESMGSRNGFVVYEEGEGAWD